MYAKMYSAAYVWLAAVRVQCMCRRMRAQLCFKC